MEWSTVGRAGLLLQNALASNRLAHAYLFTGPKGTGKLETARMFARAILCDHPVDKPCNQCLQCRKCLNGNHPDIMEIHPEGASIKIQQIREHQKVLSLKSYDVSHKIYIMNHAESMTTEAANSILKVLEEPVSPVVAILIANQANSILPTIVSRCQLVPFDRNSTEYIRHELEQNHVSTDRAHLLSVMTESIGEALKWAQSDMFAEWLAVVIQLTEDLAYNRGNPLFTIQDKVIKPNPNTEELHYFLTCLAWWYRDLLHVKLELFHDIAYKNEVERLRMQHANYQMEQITTLIDIVISTKHRLLSNVNVQLAVEYMILQLQEVKHVHRSRSAL